MKHLNKSALAIGILLAVGSTTSAWANPNNHANDVYKNDQTAYATSTQGGSNSPQANEYSTAEQNDNSHAVADDAAANNYSTANSDRSYAYAYDKSAAANNHSAAGVANGDGSAQSNNGNANGSYAESYGAATNVGNATVDNSYADVHGTGAAANGGGDATFTVDNSYAYADGKYTAAANNHSTAEVHMAIAESNLDGYVTHNTTNFTAGYHGDVNYNGNNTANYAVSNASGVINFSQNTGQNALTQQSVSTQASLTVN
jgi:hypothetical protein